MIKTTPIAVVLVTFLLPACIIPRGQAFYLSPQHASGNNYKTIPMTMDSVRSATYAGGMFTAGGVNYRLRDGILAFQGNIHQTRQWNSFQGYYGAGLSLGVYDIKRFTFPGEGVDAVWINPRGGSQFYGSGGLQGGLNFVFPFPKGEWRVIGAEAAIQHEFGNYYRFRKDIPDNAANIIERSNLYGSFGIHSEIVNRFSDGAEFGYKLGFTQSFRKVTGAIDAEKLLSGYPKYVTNTLQLTQKKWTGYGQVNIGTDAVNMQVGMIRRLFSEKKPFRKVE